MRRLIVTFAALFTLLPATALAAEPEAGKVSAESPKVEWVGSLQNPYLFHNLFNYEGAVGTGTIPCEPPSCDTFTLDNTAGGVDLLVDLASEQTGEISARIQDPSGTWTYYNGWNDSAPVTKVRIKKAAKGTYVINVIARVFGSTNPTAVTDSADYKGVATLVVPPPAVTSAVPAPAVEAPAPAPAAQPQPAPAAKKKPSARAVCQKKAKKIKNKRKRKAALKRCAKTR